MAKKYDSRFAEKYSDYNRELRTWFVAFGVGVPGALILGRDGSSTITDAPETSLVVGLLLMGTCLQIFVALLNKYVAWCNDLRSHIKSAPKQKRKKLNPVIREIAKLTRSIWIDAVIDGLTAIFFVFALILLYGILL